MSIWLVPNPLTQKTESPPLLLLHKADVVRAQSFIITACSDELIYLFSATELWARVDPEHDRCVLDYSWTSLRTCSGDSGELEQNHFW